MRLLSVQVFVLVLLFLLAVAALTYGDLAPWCIHLRHVKNFDEFWSRYTRKGFMSVRDLATYQALLVLTALWSSAGLCGIQTSHITGVIERGAVRVKCNIPYLAAAIPAVALTFAALPIDSEDPFFELGWGVRTIIVLLIYFILPFFRPTPKKMKTH
ncbi:hypothetical protein DIPPA_31887 [Diplonema papillatum]|nr:hypothetical protein DIPPA_31887 [Diplonema papillatum]|eukprot:gene12328-19061_t